MEIKEICETAERLASKFNPEGISPFPFENISAEHPDLVIVYSSTLSEAISGAITFDKEKDQFIILINQNKPAVRQYFTTAHEIAHYFLHKEILKKEDILVDGDSSLDGGHNTLFRLDEVQANLVEREANNFAASLIMPADLVKKAWLALHDVDECAKIFKVSVAALTIRLVRLELIAN